MFIVANAIPPLRSKERNATRLYSPRYLPLLRTESESIMGCGAINISLLRSENRTH